jgi:hypothetical protein
MSVIESPQAARTAQDARSDAAARPDRTAAPAPLELTDAQFGRLFILGFVYGTPVVYGVVAVVCTLAAPGHGWLLVAALWPSLLAGWFFGGMVVLTVYELREQRRQHQLSPSRARTGVRLASPWHARPVATH